MSANAQQLILCRWVREGLRLNYSSNGVRFCKDGVAVRLVRYADIVQNLSQNSSGALHNASIARAFPKSVQCRHSTCLFWADV